MIKFLCVLLVCSYTVAGSVNRYNHHKIQEKVNSNLLPNLLKVGLYTYDYKVTFSDSQTSYGTTMYADFFTEEVRDLTDVVVVQYIRGCRFNSKLVDGKIQKTIGDAREFFGKKIPYKHAKWVVDSVDTDPVYNSSSLGRHASYRWNKFSGKNAYSSKGESYYAEGLPTNPRLYIRDMPGTAFYSNGTATNISLQFRTCFMKESEIPLTSFPEDNFDNSSVKCMSWNSSFIYNFNSKNFDSPKEIDKFCLAE